MLENKSLMLRRFVFPEMRSALRMLENDLQELRGSRTPFETIFQDISRGTRSIPANVTETKESFRIEAEIPGASQKDINIELADEHSLAIHGNIKATEKSADTKVWAEERSTGEFHRVFQFPSKLAQEGIKADIKDGLLILDVPKSLDNGAKKISIDWKSL